MTDPIHQAEVVALRIILSNVVARVAAGTGAPGSPEVRATLSQMSDECKLAAERALDVADTDLSDELLRSIDQFFKAITIT